MWGCVRLRFDLNVKLFISSLDPKPRLNDEDNADTWDRSGAKEVKILRQ